MPRRNMMSKVKKLIDNTLAKRTEVKKKYDNLVTTIGTTPLVVPLLEIPQGTGENERVGNQLNLLSFYLRTQVNLGDTGFNNMRISLVKAREPILVPDVMYEPNGFSTFGAVYAQWNRRVISQVLMDRTTPINQWVSGIRSCKFYKQYKKARGKINYAGDLINTPNEFYYLVLASDSAVVPHPGCNLSLCTSFTDA